MENKSTIQNFKGRHPKHNSFEKSRPLNLNKCISFLWWIQEGKTDGVIIDASTAGSANEVARSATEEAATGVRGRSPRKFFGV